METKQQQSYKGLTPREVTASRAQHGTNVLTPAQRESLWVKFFACFADPIIRILLVALALSVGITLYHVCVDGAAASHFFEPAGILLAILLATMVGFVLELKNEKTFQSLNEVNDDTLVKVIREGNVSQVPRRDIVVGDIVLLETGEEVPADCELLEALSLTLNESTLTGEPQCTKSTNPAHFDSEATYPTNHLLKGTTLVEGYCTARVIRVGDATECGKTFEAAQVSEGSETPLNQKLTWLAHWIERLSYCLAILIVIGRLLRYASDVEHLPMGRLCLYLAIALGVAGAISLYLIRRAKRQGDEEGGANLYPLLLFFLLPIVAFFLYFSEGGSATNWVDLTAYTLNTLMIAVALICVSVPEGLPMSITLSLAFSMRKLMQQHTLPRTMHACETMGATSVICTDKTGTLTQNQMQVSAFTFAEGYHPDTPLVHQAIALNTTAFLDYSKGDRVEAVGNPTEGALLLWLAQQGANYTTLRQGSPIAERLPFTTENKYMATVAADTLFVKGAPEIVLSLCDLTAAQRTTLEQQLRDYQGRAMRTLAFAYCPMEVSTESPFEQGRLATTHRLTFIAIAAISDPIRKEVPQAIAECLSAGIAVKVVTGDTPATACEIARQIGLWSSADGEENRITGTEFAALSDEELLPKLSHLKVVSRARPNDKERLVRLLKSQGEVVAVTGDGTNDAPALNAANVGLSMGDGTAVAKEASDMTIMDNSFGTISNAVMWGRSLYKNIQRFILFQLTINVVACLIVLVGAFLGTDSPLTVTQMLWVNLIMDTFAALALASLPPSHHVMAERPRKESDFIISPAMARSIAGVGLLFFGLLLGLLLYFQHNDITTLTSLPLTWGSYNGLSSYELSLFFTTFVLLQLWNIFNARAFMSGRSALVGLSQAPLFLLMVGVILVGQIAIVSLGGEMFQVVPLSLSDWLIIIGVTSPVLWVGELFRCFNKAHHLKNKLKKSVGV